MLKFSVDCLYLGNKPKHLKIIPIKTSHFEAIKKKLSHPLTEHHNKTQHRVLTMKLGNNKGGFRLETSNWPKAEILFNSCKFKDEKTFIGASDFWSRVKLSVILNFDNSLL